MNAPNKAVFLDRDGVINQAVVREGKPYPPKNIHELCILPGVLETLNKLRDANYFLIVVTNQPDVARGSVSRGDVEFINQHLASKLPLDQFKTCYHDDIDNCCCRKPLPGALFDAAKSYQIDLTKSFMVGDRWRDIEAGKKAGCKTIFIDYDYKEQKPSTPDYIVPSLLEAGKIILGEI